MMIGCLRHLFEFGVERTQQVLVRNRAEKCHEALDDVVLPHLDNTL